VQIGQTPALGVYIIRESMGPDGDENVLEPRYLTDAIFGITTIQEIDDDKVDVSPEDGLKDLILNTLLNDLTFVSLRDGNGKEVLESIPSIAVTYDYPEKGETQYVQCRIQMTIRYRLNFDPIAVNAFSTAKITVQPPNQASVAGVAPAVPANFMHEFETALPQITITNFGGSANPGPQTIMGTAAVGASGSAVGTVYLFDSLANGLPIGYATVVAGAWSIAVTLTTLGTHNLTAVASDAIGNVGSSNTVAFNIVTGNP
jgi:hypothetical protein